MKETIFAGPTLISRRIYQVGRLPILSATAQDISPGPFKSYLIRKLEWNRI